MRFCSVFDPLSSILFLLNILFLFFRIIASVADFIHTPNICIVSFSVILYINDFKLSIDFDFFPNNFYIIIINISCNHYFFY